MLGVVHERKRIDGGDKDKMTVTRRDQMIVARGDLCIRCRLVIKDKQYL